MRESDISAVSPARSTTERIRTALVGKAKDPLAPDVFHKVSLIAFLAWIGLGADGLSSSAYGPDEAFRALGEHTYLAVALALATAFTVLIISYAYSRIIEHFPSGGGGYVVATKLLGAEFGVISGSALLVDYVLTISVSIAAAADASFSFLPAGWLGWKVPIELGVIGLFMMMNLRGVKESVTVMTPVFLLFIATHALLILGTIVVSGRSGGGVAHEMHTSFRGGLATLGWSGMAALFLRAYTRGAGTYTGIEAVSNGLQIMREPRVATARRTMVYMSLSLAVTAGGILFCYLLMHVVPVPDKTMNAVLVERFAGNFSWAGLPLGYWFVIATLGSETALLAIAAQTGFIDGPRVMANMAADSWLPHRFSHLSDQLTMKNGVMLISGAAILTLVYTWGETGTLVLMYSINVFLTFSLSQLGMARFWLDNRVKYPDWSRHIIIHIIGLVLCFSILVVSIIEKFTEGAWLTVVVTTALIGFCLLIRRHYRMTERSLRHLDELIVELPETSDAGLRTPLDTDAPTAACFVKDYNGLGIQSVLAVPLLFGTQFENFVFIAAGVIDSSRFKGVEEIENLREHTEQELKKYALLLNRRGYSAEYCYALGTDPIDELERLAHRVSKRFPRVVFFASKLIFKEEHFWHKVLHNQAAFTLERRLQFAGLQTVVLAVAGDAAAGAHPA
jgi:amino acid transporter